VHNQFTAVSRAHPQDFHEGTEVHQCIPEWRVCSDANVMVSATERRINGAHQAFTRWDTNTGVSELASELFELLAGDHIFARNPVDFGCNFFVTLSGGSSMHRRVPSKTQSNISLRNAHSPSP
jgi:hypothetical protein